MTRNNKVQHSDTVKYTHIVIYNKNIKLLLINYYINDDL